MHPTHEQHHLGRLLPPMSQDDFQRLCADVAAHGLLEDIILYEGKILDGWSRYRACQAGRVEPRFREFAGDNPVAYVLSKNLQRRHLNPVQILRVLESARHPLEAEAARRKRAGIKQPVPPSEHDLGQNSAQGVRVSEQIAGMAGVSKQTVKDYRAVQVHGSPELKEAVDREEVAISDAAKIARHQSPDKQTEAVKRVRAGNASTLRQAVARTESSPVTCDRLGLPVPDDLTFVFEAIPHFREAKACLSRMKKLVMELLDCPAGTRITTSEWPVLASQIDDLRNRLGELEPYSLCPDCLGQGCPFSANQYQPLCHGGGFINRRQYQQLAEAAKERLQDRKRIE